MKYLLLLLSLLLLDSCGSYEGSSDYKSFHYGLRGVWETTKEADSLYAKITIEYKYITVIGSKNISHFADLPPNVRFEGYSIVSDDKDSLMYVCDWEDCKNIATYSIWITGPYDARDTLLILKGQPVETFRKVGSAL